MSVILPQDAIVKEMSSNRYSWHILLLFTCIILVVSQYCRLVQNGQTLHTAGQVTLLMLAITDPISMHQALLRLKHHYKLRCLLGSS